MKHALAHTCLRYFSFLGDVCLLSLPGQVQLDFKKLLVPLKVCTLLSKLIIGMHFWSFYSRCYCSSVSFTKGCNSTVIQLHLTAEMRGPHRHAQVWRTNEGQRFSVSLLHFFLYDSCSFSTFARRWSVFYSHFCLYFTMPKRTFWYQRNFVPFLLQFFLLKSLEKIKIWLSRSFSGDKCAH